MKYWHRFAQYIEKLCPWGFATHGETKENLPGINLIHKISNVK